MLNLRHNQRQWVTKHASHNCGVGATLQEWNFQDHAICPRCKDAEETTLHVFLCQAQGAKACFHKSMKRLNTQLKRHQTQRSLRHAIIHALERWQQGLNPIPENLSPAIRNVLQHQTEIGWDQFMLGLPSTKWAVYQQSYYKAQRSRRTGKKWLRRILPHIIQAGRKQWLHRSDYKHNIGKTDDTEMKTLLHEAIVNQFQLGEHTLLVGDKAKLDYNLIHLLNKPLHIKRAWWHNIHAARQRYHRKQQHDDALRLESRQSSLLLKWIYGQQST